MNHRKFFILFGPPGSGKGTQGAKLAARLSLSHISIGSLLRDMVEKNAPEALLINSYISSGKLMPSDFVNTVVRSNVIDKFKDGCIIDGYPRSVEQAEYLDKMILARAVAILFDAMDDVVKKRILGRFSCGHCGAVYNKFFQLPKVDSICDTCTGIDFVYRTDDNEETFSDRLTAYKQQTLPLAEYYHARGRLVRVNANQGGDEVFTELLSLIENV